MKILQAIGKKMYRLGDSGDVVKAIQLALKARGYALTGTGWFGNATDTAVEAFQRSAGLKVDGEVGPATAASLDAPLTKAQAPLAKTERPLWLEVSLAHNGLKEGVGAANNKELVADIKTVAKDYQNDSTPWCAGWVSFCLSKAGEKPSSQPLWALSYSDVKNQPVVRLAGPAVGAIAVKTRNGGGHVTFVAGRTKGGTLACSGGNQNDQVSVAPYAENVFVGFFWPAGAPLPEMVGFSHLPIVTTTGRPIVSEA